MQHLRQAVKQDDRDADAWHFLALSYLKLDQNKDARKALEHAVALRPDNSAKDAVEAAKQIKFVPATKGAQPISTVSTIEYQFLPK